jgi:hypothetical protein
MTPINLWNLPTLYKDFTLYHWNLKKEFDYE